MRKFVISLMVLATIALCCVPIGFAEDNSKMDARAAYLVDFNTNTVMYEKDCTKRLPIASMVKIMTALLAFEALDNSTINLNQKIVISENASGMGGSQMFLETGDEYTVSDLMKGIIVVSANDACVAIAEAIAGSEQDFVVKMNKRAVELGMENTNFSNVTGLPAPEQYSCAKDVSVMLKELMRHQKYYDYSKIWIEDYNHPDGRVTQFVNTNKLIRFYKGCEGGKTGFTNEALFCLAASACKDGMNIIAVVIGSSTSKARFGAVTTLFNKAFAGYENKLIINSGQTLGNQLAVNNSKQNFIDVYPSQNYYVFGKKGEVVEPNISYEYFDVSAPLKKGSTVGKITVAKGDEQIIIDILAGEDAEALTYWDIVDKIEKGW